MYISTNVNYWGFCSLFTSSFCFVLSYSTDLSLQNDVSGCVLNCSVTECYREYKSTEENLSSFSSPELVRGADYFGEDIISTLIFSTIELLLCSQILQ